MATTEENIAVSRRLIEDAFNGGNLDVIDELCADGYVNHDPVVGDEDRAAAKQTIAGYQAAFPDLKFTIDDVIASGDMVVMRWSANGTFENEFMGQAPTGEMGEPVHGIGIDRLEDGKIAESWGQWDTLTLHAEHRRNAGAGRSQRLVR